MMKTDSPAIAKTELVRICKNGEQVAVSIEIGKPYKIPNGFWRTPVALHGIDGRLSDITGEDSLQSLCLATEMVYRRLVSVLDNGDRLIDSEGTDFPTETYFPMR
jgi:hypothetical protein